MIPVVTRKEAAVDGYEATTYGDTIAGAYDDLYGTLFDVQGAVDFLEKHGRPGPVLELGIGTGRIALPLKERGVEILGIDASHAMVQRLRTKPGGTEIPVIMGEFARADLGGPYSMVFVVFNTFFANVSQEEQIECFSNVARALGDGGIFVIEAFVPDQSRFDRHQRVEVDRVGLDEVALSVSMHDSAGQRVDTQHILISEEEIRLFPTHIRYAWPSELDLMARLAGLTLRERRASWRDDRFTSTSQSHVSVYAKES
jgi:SAM-dependent methyltransferase